MNTSTSFVVLEQSFQQKDHYDFLREQNCFLKQRVSFLENQNQFQKKAVSEKDEKIQEAKSTIAVLSKNVLRLSKILLEKDEIKKSREEYEADMQQVFQNKLVQKLKEQAVQFQKEMQKLKESLKQKIKDNNILYAKNEKHKKKDKENQKKIRDLMKKQAQNICQSNILQKYVEEIRKISQEKAQLQMKVTELEVKLKFNFKKSTRLSVEYSKPIVSDILSSEYEFP